VSDSKNVPKPPPPDDFSKTTPNINIPKDDKPNDWEKTNYGFSPQPPADDWGKTVANFNVPARRNDEDPDFSKTYAPSNQPKSSDEWGMTQANININPADFGSKAEDYSERGGSAPVNYEMTTPLIRLPEAERIKYQNLPPTPTEEAERKKEEEKKGIGGIPNWVWIAAGLMSMFFFAVVVIVGAWYILSRRTDFEVVIKNAPARSSVKVDGQDWGVPKSDDGTIILQNLEAKSRKIEIIHPTFVCEPLQVDGSDRAGETIEINAVCQTQKVAPGEDCSNIGIGEEDKSERCANAALDKLPDPPPIDDLLNALNLLIINFESGKFNIPDERMAFLKRAAGYIQKLPPGTIIEIGGHTDSDGTDAYNQNLSENRARAVKTALVNFGVKPEMLTEKGYGETRLKFPAEKGELEKYKNRRIEYTAVRR
jgi:outer membrane protein OmpA-like peptidoglycan-associated protein